MTDMKTLKLSCSKCSETKPDTEFYAAKHNVGRRGRASWCKVCVRGAVSEHHKRTGYRVSKEYMRDYRARLRAEVVAALGGQCLVCDYAPGDTRLLDIDHVNGDGLKDRNTYGMFRRILAGHVDGYQLLCPSCHREKTLAAGEHKKRVDKP